MRQRFIRLTTIVLILAFALASVGFMRPIGAATLADWEKVGSSWVYYGENGRRVTGWQQIGGKWFYFNASGIMQTGWQQIGGKWFYFNKNGVMQTGWQQIGGKWFYFNGNGVMQTGWQQLGGKWYYFASGGQMQTGWQQIGGKWYYFASGGAMQTGWQQIGGQWYYFASGGAMQTGWQKIGGKWYYFNTSGAMHTGWLQDGEYWYYLKENGVMAADEVVNGYRFNASGRWIKDVKPSDALNRENILALLDGYDPDGAYIIRNSSESGLMDWFLSSMVTIEDGLRRMETAVHEQCHDFCATPIGGRYNSVTGKYTSASEYIYLGGNRYADVPLTDVYDSIEMVSIIPEDLQNTSRFDTYVNTDNVYMASRQEGVYGLFNEFTAYCWGMNNINQMAVYKADNSISDPYINNNYVAYAEFRYYILTYLIYAQTNYPAVYSGIIGNSTFCRAFVSVESTFLNAVNVYRSTHGNYVSFDTEYNKLMSAMNASQYTSMMATLRANS